MVIGKWTTEKLTCFTHLHVNFSEYFCAHTNRDSNNIQQQWVQCFGKIPLWRLFPKCTYWNTLHLHSQWKAKTQLYFCISSENHCCVSGLSASSPQTSHIEGKKNSIPHFAFITLNVFSSASQVTKTIITTFLCHQGILLSNCCTVCLYSLLLNSMHCVGSASALHSQALIDQISNLDGFIQPLWTLALRRPVTVISLTTKNLNTL